MPIQIGMSCDPQWLCDGIGWLLGLIVIMLLVGLLKVVRKEIKQSKPRKYKIRRSRRRDGPPNDTKP